MAEPEETDLSATARTLQLPCIVLKVRTDQVEGYSAVLLATAVVLRKA